MVIKPTIAQWQETRPNPIGLEILEKIPLQPKHAKEAQPVEAESKPAKPRPIFPNLFDLISTRPKPKVEVPPIEVESAKPAESWSGRFKRPDQPALL